MAGSGQGDMVDLEALKSILEDLAIWGLVEDRDGVPHTTARWREALLAAAQELREEERAGTAPDAAPLHAATERALRKLDLLAEGEEADHVAVLVALEIRQMPPGMRGMLGIPED